MIETIFSDLYNLEQQITFEDTLFFGVVWVFSFLHSEALPSY